MARSQELLLVFAIAWGMGLAALGEWVGFSKEAGAFLAGFSLASTPYREAIGGRLTGIRDFLLLFFFIDLGAKLDLSTLGGEVGRRSCSRLRAHRQPADRDGHHGLHGLSQTHRLPGRAHGGADQRVLHRLRGHGHHARSRGREALGLTTLVGLVTITLSTYMILYSQPLYRRLAPWLWPFERRQPHRELAAEQHGEGDGHPDVLVFGLGRYGRRLAERLQAADLRVLGVDFDPERANELARADLEVRFGDAQDPGFLASLPLAGARWAVSTLPDLDSNRSLLHGLAERDSAGTSPWSRATRPRARRCGGRRPCGALPLPRRGGLRRRESGHDADA